MKPKHSLKQAGAVGFGCVEVEGDQYDELTGVERRRHGFSQINKSYSKIMSRITYTLVKIVSFSFRHNLYRLSLINECMEWIRLSFIKYLDKRRAHSDILNLINIVPGMEIYEL